MPDRNKRIEHYATYIKMYGEMMQDLSQCDRYVTKLIDNEKLDNLETVLRSLIEKSPKF